MPTVYPTAAGNWSTRTWFNDATGAVYSAGTPQPGDIVLGNGLAIAIDQNITVAEISNRVGTNAVAGGTFNVTNASNGFTINGNITSGTADVVVCTHTSGNSFTVNGQVSGSLTTAAAEGVVNTSSGSLTINGNVVGGGAASAVGARNASNGLLTINGNVTGGTAGNTSGCQNGSSGTLIVNGNSFGGTGSQSFGSQNVSTGTLIVNGSVRGGIHNQAHGVFGNNILGTTIVNGFALATATSTTAFAGFIKIQNPETFTIEISDSSNIIRTFLQVTGSVKRLFSHFG